MSTASASSTSVSEQVAPALRVIERAIRQICLRFNEQGLIALLKSVLLFAALFAIKESLKGTFGYECPRQGYFFYGSLYIFGPAVFFLCFAFVFSRPFWEFVTGCCRLSCNKLKRLLASPSSAVDVYLAISAPVLWVAFGLSEEDYYLCAMYGPLSHEEMRSMWLGTGPGPRWILDAKSHCHVLVWAIIMSWAITSTVLVSLYRCCVRDAEEIQKEVTTA